MTSVNSNKQVALKLSAHHTQAIFHQGEHNMAQHNNTSNSIVCEHLSLPWSGDSLVANNNMDLSDLEDISYSNGKVYSLDFVSLQMINPFNDLDIPLQSLLCLFTIFFRISLIILYIYWPSPNQETVSSIFCKDNRSKPVSDEKVSYDYECFDCNFVCASRHDSV